MSRELLKRALDELLGQENGASINELVQDIETYLAQPDGPVAWIEVGHPIDGPYDCHYMVILPKGKHHVYTSPPDQSARVAELEKSETFLTECIDAAINDREYYEQKFKEAKAGYDECSQAVFWLGKERDDLKLELSALQVKREPLSDEDIIRCGHKAGFYIDAVENEDTEEFIEGFINEDGEVDNESFIAFARAIEAAHGIKEE